MTSTGPRHSLADWLTLHELDRDACTRILDAVTREAARKPAAGNGQASGSDFSDPDAAWLSTVDAMRAFFPAQQLLIDETFANTTKMMVDQGDRPGRALTLDNGPDAYPTVLYSYDGRPADALVIAHEFAHALQIRASGGRFVSPIVREVCAFVGEGALMSYTRSKDPAQHRGLVEAWHRGNRKYLGTDRDRLTSALSQPETPYRYSWNYPIARYLAIELSRRGSPDRTWTVFEGGLSVRSILKELDLGDLA